MGSGTKQRKTRGRPKRITESGKLNKEKKDDIISSARHLKQTDRSTSPSNECDTEYRHLGHNGEQSDDRSFDQKSGVDEETLRRSCSSYPSKSSRSPKDEKPTPVDQKACKGADRERDSQAPADTAFWTEIAPSDNVCELYPLGFNNRVQMIIDGVPIVAVRSLFSVISPLPIGIVSLHTLYCRARRIIFARSRKFHAERDQLFIFNGIDGIKLFSEGDLEYFHDSLSTKLSLSKNTQSKHGAEQNSHRKNKKRERRSDAIITSIDIFKKGQYRVCSVNGNSVCQCRVRAHSLTLEEIKTFAIFPNFHPGKTYYVYGFARFRKKRSKYSGTIDCDGLCLIVSVDGHIFAVQNDYIAAIKFFNEMTAQELKQFDLKEINPDYRHQTKENCTNLASRGFNLNSIAHECLPVHAPILSNIFKEQMGNFAQDEPKVLDELRYHNSDVSPIIADTILKYQPQSIRMLTPTTHPVPPFALELGPQRAIAKAQQTKHFSYPSLPKTTKMVGNKYKRERETLKIALKEQEGKIKIKEVNNKISTETHPRKANKSVSEEERNKIKKGGSTNSASATFSEIDSSETFSTTNLAGQFTETTPTASPQKNKNLQMSKRNKPHCSPETEELLKKQLLLEKVDRFLLRSLPAYKTFCRSASLTDKKRANTTNQAKIRKYLDEGAQLTYLFKTGRDINANIQGIDEDIASISSMSTEDELIEVNTQKKPKVIGKKREREEKYEKLRAESEQYRKKLRTRRIDEQEKEEHTEKTIKDKNESKKKQRINKQKSNNTNNSNSINENDNKFDSILAENEPTNLVEAKQKNAAQQVKSNNKSVSMANSTESMDIDMDQEYDKHESIITFKEHKENNETENQDSQSMILLSQTSTQSIDQDQRENDSQDNNSSLEGNTISTHLSSFQQFAEPNKLTAKLSGASVENSPQEQNKELGIQNRTSKYNTENGNDHQHEQYSTNRNILYPTFYQNESSKRRRAKVQQALKEKLQSLCSNAQHNFGKRLFELKAKLCDSVKASKHLLTRIQVNYLKSLIDELTRMEYCNN